MNISREKFDQWVVRAIDMVPKNLLKNMGNVVFAVDDRPTREQLKTCGLRRGYALFGLYQGCEQYGRKKKNLKPDMISIFRKAIMEQYSTVRSIRTQVYKTVWHEIAHHFGGDEDAAVRAEKKMFSKYVSGNMYMTIQKREMKKISNVRRGRNGYKRKGKVTFRVEFAK